MKDNSTNTTEKMTTEEFHRLLEENVQKQAEARTNYQLQLTDLPAAPCAHCGCDLLRCAAC
jgi:hypothetical protein